MARKNWKKRVRRAAPVAALAVGEAGLLAINPAIGIATALVVANVYLYGKKKTKT